MPALEVAPSSYDVKYAGKNYASILVMGLYSDHEMNEPIIQGFNFDLRTGEAVELKDLVRPAGKFWTWFAMKPKRPGFPSRKRRERILL